MEPSRANDDYFCANETLIRMDKDLSIRPCAAWEKYCVTTIETSLQAFSAISRSCSEACRKNCELDGYGTDIVRCDHCCETNMCNSNYSVKYYLYVMEGQYSSWMAPKKGEMLFNKQRGLRFPYNNAKTPSYNVLLIVIVCFCLSANVFI